MAHFEYKAQNGLNHVMIYDVLTQQQLNKLWTCYEYAKDHFGGPEVTGTATYEDGTSRKNNKGCFLTDMKPEPVIVSVFNKVVYDGLKSIAHTLPVDSVYSTMQIIKKVPVLMQYYLDDGQRYDTHYDRANFTVLLFFNQGERNFTGGDLDFPEFGITVPFVHNTGVIFPGRAGHRVNPVYQINKNISSGGRLSIAMFCSI